MVESKIEKNKIEMLKIHYWLIIAAIAAPILAIGTFKIKNAMNKNGSKEPGVSEVAYEGFFDGQSIRYSEDHSGNIIEVDRGKEIYVFRDTVDQTSLNWESSSTNRTPAKLESLEIVKKRTFLDDRIEFSYDKLDDKTLYGQKGKEFLDRGSVYMNRVRKYVAQQKRKDYLNRLSGLDGFLQRHAKTASTNSTKASGSTNIADAVID
jgi:hypothetical protein